MSLFLVGENIDKTRSHYLSETGRLVQLMRGIYVEAGSNIEELVLKHAVRIARYLYPRAYLSAASAALLGPTADGKLFISGPRIQRTRIRGLEIVQNKAPEFASTSPAFIDDGAGEFTVMISSVRQRFLESFRRKSEHGASVDSSMRQTMAKRVIDEFGDPEKAADALWALARKNEWIWEAGQAERYLKQASDRGPIKNEAGFDLFVAWHAVVIGKLSNDGFEWYWYPNKGFHLPLVRQTIPGRLPAFINSLLPEGWLENVLRNADERTMLRSGKRYMSNITIADSKNDLAQLPSDILTVSLTEFSKQGLFFGQYVGPGKDNIEASFERNLATIYNNADTPRLSGVQIKAPMSLDQTGTLQPSTDLPFTHILKPAGTGGFEYLPIVEYVSLTLGRSIGFDSPEFALTNMPDDMLPALIVERFDIRRSLGDNRLLAMEDFCSLLDITAAEKYNGTIEQAGRALRAISTSPTEDLLLLLKRALFAWLIADGDMHLKNLAVLKSALPGQKSFQSIRMAPIYDLVSTVVFPRLKNDNMAIKLNGKANRIRRNDFIIAAATMGLKVSDVEIEINETLATLTQAIRRISLPDGLIYPT
ncbi:MAG: HipA domain-containing protein, partial [Chitinophagaceae bacterium]|nr:HipA domain-containing protein [Chitinophagaceae bacterium]